MFVALTVRTLTDHGQVDVLPPRQRTEQTVHVTADTTTVSRHARGVNQHPGHLTGGHSVLLTRTRRHTTYGRPDRSLRPPPMRRAPTRPDRQGQFASASSARRTASRSETRRVSPAGLLAGPALVRQTDLVHSGRCNSATMAILFGGSGASTAA